MSRVVASRPRDGGQGAAAQHYGEPGVRGKPAPVAPALPGPWSCPDPAAAPRPATSWPCPGPARLLRPRAVHANLAAGPSLLSPQRVLYYTSIVSPQDRKTMARSWPLVNLGRAETRARPPLTSRSCRAMARARALPRRRRSSTRAWSGASKTACSAWCGTRRPSQPHGRSHGASCVCVCCFEMNPGHFGLPERAAWAS